jgi:hypothetical protein
MDLIDEKGDSIGTGVAPNANSAANTTVVPVYKAPVEIRITQVDGGYLVNKFGQPLEVCITLDEVTSKVSAFFTPVTQSGAEVTGPA